ncbi:hypothetical protein DPMN_103298, partial [Dreissena polymorpha]
MAAKNHVAPYVNPAQEPKEMAANDLRKESKTRLIVKERMQKAARFNAFYKQLGSNVKPEQKRIDYVLVFPNTSISEIEDEDDKHDFEKRMALREKFEAAMEEQGLQLQKLVIGDKVFTQIHCPFRRLCEEAELVSLEMPLKDCESENVDTPTFLDKFIRDNFVTDDQVDLVSAPFKMEHMNLYDGHDDPTNFFRPALRAILVEHILINIDLRTTGESARNLFKKGKLADMSPTALEQSLKAILQRYRSGSCCGCVKGNNELGDLQKVGLDYMMMEGVYTDKFVLHEESAYDPDADSKINAALPQDKNTLKLDPRLDLQLTWPRFFKFQPLWKIRNYFGEKIAFYFAWSGVLITSLWLPMLFGFAVFLYGLVESIQKTLNSNTNSGSGGNFTDLFRNIKESFDNDVTPFFAMFICIWGTLFLEAWKRKQSELAYQWDVEQFEENEPDRPEFYGTDRKIDPVTQEVDWYYPFRRQAWKFLLSISTLLFMICVVIISVSAVIVYRVIATVDYCRLLSSSECLMVSTIVSSVLNAISILILGKLYDWLAKKLTDWENHRTETKYNDSLIIKLFAFQFVNTYSACFYIAFARGRVDDNGILGLGAKYQDACEGTCMSQLSFQVLTLMITKPIPKFAADVIIPWLLKQWRARCQCCACIPFLRKLLRVDSKPKSEKTLLEIESEKPSLGPFTMAEYNEKILLYGLMMLFAVSFPLAPLLALLVLLLDIRIDAKRMLWWYQRPQPVIAEDIGTWYVVLQFLNFAGVVSNAFLIAFTSSWGSKYTTYEKLWIVIGFEHIVFVLKFLLAYLIPDTPSSVALAIRKKHYQYRKVLEEHEMKVKDNNTMDNETEVQETEVRQLKKKKKRNRESKELRKEGDGSPPVYSIRT